MTRPGPGRGAVLLAVLLIALALAALAAASLTLAAMRLQLVATAFDERRAAAAADGAALLLEAVASDALARDGRLPDAVRLRAAPAASTVAEASWSVVTATPEKLEVRIEGRSGETRVQRTLTLARVAGPPPRVRRLALR